MGNGDKKEDPRGRVKDERIEPYSLSAILLRVSIT